MKFVLSGPPDMVHCGLMETSTAIGNHHLKHPPKWQFLLGKVRMNPVCLGASQMSKRLLPRLFTEISSEPFGAREVFEKPLAKWEQLGNSQEPGGS